MSVYAILLALHSLLRWLVVLSLPYAVYRYYRGWKSLRPFSSFDNKLRILVVNIVQLQLFIGICLYFISPIVDYFLHNFNTAVHERQIRFFGMEHITMMTIAVVMISIVSAKSKLKTAGTEKFRILAIWFTIAFFIIFISIPWSFSPLVSR